MSKSKKSQKKVIKTSPAKARRTAQTTKSSKSSALSSIPLIFNKQNYLWMGIGFGLILLGLLLMSGGGSESPDVFDADRIYSFRRITLAPLMIICGLLVEVYAIFKK